MNPDAAPVPQREASAQPDGPSPAFHHPAATFRERLAWCMENGQLGIADLAYWFDKPYHTVWFWVYKNRLPRVIKGQRKLMMARLSHLEKSIPSRFPITDDLNQFERPKHIAKIRIGLESQVLDNVEGHYERYGWHKTSFLYGHRLYETSSITNALGTAALNARSQWLMPARGGSLSEWSRAANTLFSQGCEAQSFALLCSFAAPLMQFFDTGNRGAILSLVNVTRGNGTYTALQAIESVWGANDATHVRQADVESGNILGNLPILYDELSLRDPEIIRDFIAEFTNGDPFPSILVLPSNYSINRVLRGLDKRNSFPVFEIIVKVPQSRKHASTLHRELRNNCGYAADAFLRRLVQPETIEFIQAGLPQWVNQVQRYTKAGPNKQPAVRMIAAVVAASTIVKSIGLLDFSASRIVTWAMDYLIHGHHTNSKA